jgi:hypothetical protein
VLVQLHTAGLALPIEVLYGVQDTALLAKPVGQHTTAQHSVACQSSMAGHALLIEVFYGAAHRTGGKTCTLPHHGTACTQ